MLLQSSLFALSGEKLTLRLRQMAFKAMLRQASSVGTWSHDLTYHYEFIIMKVVQIKPNLDLPCFTCRRLVGSMIVTTA